MRARIKQVQTFRVLHRQTTCVIDEYVSFDSPEEARRALVDVRTQNPFSVRRKAQSATRLVAYRVSLVGRVPASWKPDPREEAV